MKKFSLPIKIKKRTIAVVLSIPLAIGSPIAARAIDLSFLNDVLGVVDQFFGIDSGQFLDDAIAIVEQFSDFNFGNFDLNAVLGEILNGLGGSDVLGDLGLPDPNDLGSTVADNDQANENLGIFDNVTYPEQGMVQHARQDNLNSAQVQAYVAGILSKEGQTQAAEKLKISGSYAASSQGGLAETVKQSQQAATDAQEAEDQAMAAREEALAAQEETESQAVLKRIATILSKSVDNSASAASQLSSLSNQASIQSGQLSAIAGSSDISNQILTELKIGQAYQTMELTNTSQAIRQLNETNKAEKRSISNGAGDSMDLFYIPGLAPRPEETPPL